MSEKRIIFHIPGEPVGKGRPRFVRATGRTFTPKKTATYENLVKMEFERQCAGQVFWPAEMLRMEIRAYYGLAASDSKKKRQLKVRGILRPVKRPDCDNIGKIIADALNGLAYRDDAQIVEMLIEKFYGETPRVEVEIRTIVEGG